MFIQIILYFSYFSLCYSARILAVLPAPFPSHQAVFRPFTLELAKRGHEVVVITTDPVFKENPPNNYTEIDIHDVSYDFRNKNPPKMTGHTDDMYAQINDFFDLFAKILEKQMESKELKKFINDKSQHFDLLIIEACVRPALVFSHLFKAPVITISSLGTLQLYTDYLGVPEHPILYPTCAKQKLYNLTLWDKAIEVFKSYYADEVFKRLEVKEDQILKRVFGEDVPSLRELKKNVVMLMLNVHRIWECNRPVPPNVIYLGGLHLANSTIQKMNKELKNYLDSSPQCVIYMSMGSLVMPSHLQNIKIVLRALSKLPYNVLLKWDEDHLPECPSNFKVMKWTPQRELLHHPNIKLFITQGGLQSTDEAIVAEVPLIGIPILGDQWYNVEMYIRLKIGLGIELGTVTEDQVIDTVNKVLGDESYKRNIQELHKKLFDQPQSALERAVWWTEYILRNGNTSYNRHNHYLISPAAHLSNWDYYEGDLILRLFIILCLTLTILVFLLVKVFKLLIRIRNNVNIVKVKRT